MKVLEGLVVINTRPEGQQEELSALLRDRGAVVQELPLVTIVPRPSVAGLKRRFSGMTARDWVIFTSRNGVEAAAAVIPSSPLFSLAAIGRKTALVLERRGFKPAFVSAAGNSIGFAQEFIDHLRSSSGLESSRALLLRGGHAGRELPRLLGQQIEVEEEVVYDDVVLEVPEERRREVYGIVRAAVAGDRENLMLVLTSSRGAGLFVQLGQNPHDVDGADWLSLIRKIPVAVIGPKTAQTALECGFERLIQAAEPSLESMVRGIEEFYQIEGDRHVS